MGYLILTELNLTWFHFHFGFLFNESLCRLCMKRAPVYAETAILCVFDMTSPYEVVLEASASGIPVIVQWNPLYEEIFEDNCIYIKKDSEWSQIISLLKRNQLFYREQSQKSLKMSLLYDSSRKMDVFLNCVFSGINNI